MRLTTWIPLGLAIVLGLAAAFVARGMMSNRKAAGQGPQLQKVVTAAVNVAPGSALKPTDLTTGQVAGETRPEGSYAELNELVGRVVTSPVVKGQVVVEPLLAPKGALAGVQNLVSDGMRLTTVEVNEFSSLAGLLAPGCRVDILATLADSETKETMARTIVENVKVVAVGQRVSTTPAAGGPGGEVAPASDEPGFRSVTLEVSPHEAEAIHVAGLGGRPWMVLRGTGDNEEVASPGVSLAQLRTGAKPRAGAGSAFANALTELVEAKATKPVSSPATRPAEEPRRQREVTFIRGGKVETITVETTPVEPPFGGVITSTSEVPGEHH